MKQVFNPLSGQFDTVLSTASELANVPAGSVAATNVQAAINELDTEKQPTGNYITALTGEVTASGPGSVAATIANNAVTPAKLNALLQSQISSGIISGGVVTINADPTKIDITAGTGIIVDYWTTPSTPVVYNVSWSAQIGVTVTNLATSTLSFVGFDTAGSVVQYSTFPSFDTRREIILLAQLGHTAGTAVQNVSPQYTVVQSPMDQLRDVIQDFKFINSGNVISANGANLNINKSAGSLLGFGVNYTTDVQNPNVVTIGAQTAATFQYRTQTGVSGANTTSIVPGSYDNAGTVTAIGGSNNQATNQHVYLFPNGNIRIQYGQTIYSTLTTAIQNVGVENFVEYANIEAGAQLIGIISVTKGATDLSDTTQARFLRVSKLGESAVGGSGTSTTNLQQAYTNSSDPEILTDSTRGAVSIRRGSAADTDAVLEGLNNASSVTFSVTGNGVVKSTAVTASRLLVSDASQNISSSSVTSTEAGYLSGVTSTIQTQLNAKEPTITGAATTITGSNLTVSRALVSDGSGKVAAATTTSTEIGYVNGVTSAIQTQIDGKMTNPMTTGGDVIYGGASGTPTRLANGSSGQVLTSAGGTSAPTWSTPSMVLLSTQTASSSATIDFTSISSGTYSSYVLVGSNIVPATNAVYLIMRMSVGGSFLSGGSDYSQRAYRYVASGAAAEGYAAGTGIAISPIGETMSNSTTFGNNFRVEIYSHTGSTYKSVNGQFTGYGSSYISSVFGGSTLTASAIDGFRLLMSSGNIASGTFKLYGVV